jgi:NADH-quinone oxidoreductase subunit N
VQSQQWWLLGAHWWQRHHGVFTAHLRVMVMFMLEPNLYRHDAPFSWAQRAGGIMLLLVAVLAFRSRCLSAAVAGLVQQAGLRQPYCHEWLPPGALV